MSQTDPIADMLTCVRNAVRAGHRRVDIPSSRLKEAIAETLVRERYVQSCRRIEDTKQGILRIYLRRAEGATPVITNLQRVSRPGRRIYVGKDEVPRIMGGMGSAILSTTKGILTDKEARTAGLGGEVLARVW
ncbi:MAG: 30S ribosomal protein S8 [Candidatus Eisenbacteria bacterium]|nr:30S ribosomal protein S8 [Candidatus Latescibacterota bacterium]MBD3301967.1 30S ribosomal protein S8 [Candidatus Eisenbacteria bacterium]